MAAPLRSNKNVTTVEFEFTPQGLESFKKRLSDLYLIVPVARMRIYPDYVLVYAGDKKFLSFKSTTFDLDGFLELKSGTIPDQGLDFIFLNTRHVVQSIKFFRGTNPVRLKVRTNNGNPVAHEVKFSDGELTLSFVGGDPTEIKGITKAQIEKKGNLADSNFTFAITGEQLMTVKRLAQQREQESISVWIGDGIVEMGQSSWRVNVGTTTEEDQFIFAKKFLSTIEVADVIEFHAFDAFLLVKGADSTLLIGRELDEL